MVEQLATAELDSVFRSLSDPTRRAMLRMLADGEHSVGELAEPFEMSFAGASKHVRVLEDAGLVRRTVRGRVHSCQLVTDRLRVADEWFDFYSRFWSRRLDALESAINEERAGATRDAHRGTASTDPSSTTSHRSSGQPRKDEQ